jgi:hypothetical protein
MIIWFNLLLAFGKLPVSLLLSSGRIPGILGCLIPYNFHPLILSFDGARTLEKTIKNFVPEDVLIAREKTGQGLTTYAEL